MTKAGIVGLMETLASELKDTNVGASAFCPGPVLGNLSKTTPEVRPAHLQNDAAPTPPPPRPNPPEGAPKIDMGKYLMSAEEVGERVIRGIRRKDLYIVTHSEFKDVMSAKAGALMRAYPDQPIDEDMKKLFSILTVNPVYDTQTTPGAPDWN
jgi:short-subunit dehydrogenase